MISALVCSRQPMMLASPRVEYTTSDARSAQMATDRHVIVHANRDREKAAAFVGEIVACGGSVEAVIFDVAEREATATALSDIVAAGAIQILVNNAGIDADAVFPAMSGEQWDSVIDVAVIAFLNVTRPLILLMIRRR